MFHRILVGIDGSPNAKNALHDAIVLARTTTGRVHALAVCEPIVLGTMPAEVVDQTTGAERACLEEALVEARRIAADQGGLEITSELRTGNVAQEIIKVAREGLFDLIALGAHGQRPVDEFLMGTTSDRVARHAPCSVRTALGGTVRSEQNALLGDRDVVAGLVDHVRIDRDRVDPEADERFRVLGID